MPTATVDSMAEFVTAVAGAVDSGIGKEIEAGIAEEGEESCHYDMVRHDLLEALEHFGIEVVEDEEVEE